MTPSTSSSSRQQRSHLTQLLEKKLQDDIVYKLTWSHVDQEDQTTNNGYERISEACKRNQFCHIQSVWKKSYLQDIVSAAITNLNKSLGLLQEIALMMMGFYAPPIVRENVEDAQNDDKERGGPLGLETNGNHGASNKTNYGNQETHEIPLTLKDEAKEEEDQENTTSKQNT